MYRENIFIKGLKLYMALNVIAQNIFRQKIIKKIYINHCESIS